MPRPWRTSEPEVEAIVAGRHGDPFAVLGLHRVGGDWLARTFVPGAETIEVVDLSGAPSGILERRHEAGFFEGKVAIADRRPLRYEARNSAGSWSLIDAYIFGPVLGPLDDYYAAEGTHLRLYDKLGAHLMTHEGVAGCHFAVWAPNAQRVSIVGDFNAWDGRRHVMRKRMDTGVWEIFLPEVGEGACYKYEIIGIDGKLLPLKADPFGFWAELRPKTASRVAPTDNFTWNDGKYLENRKGIDLRRSPISIYEAHLGSWRRHPDGSFLDYEALGRELIPYVS